MYAKEKKIHAKSLCMVRLSCCMHAMRKMIHA